ncbi:hypothetical protein MP228_005726 [Amoeboaphelidium protococcarum]|nr:hypothetical protein MP228_005726 [Amoeboaphelidium protococcarum]
MSLWVDKHRPKQLKDLGHSPDLTKTLHSLAKNGADMPHLLVYGQSGAGKKTRVHCLLRELFGAGVDKMGIHNKMYTVTSGSSNQKLECTVLSSSWHLEMNPSDNGQSQDRLVIQEVVKEIASMGNVVEVAHVGDDQQQQDQDDVKPTRPRYKPIVLHNADALSVSAQHALRRTMEKYSKQIRLILIAENISRIISPIRSRCLGIRVGAPSKMECVDLLQKVGRKEGVRVSGDEDLVYGRFVDASKFNIRRSMLMLEAASVQAHQSALSVNTQIPIADYIVFIKSVCDVVFREQNNSAVLKVRSMLYELLSKCIPPAMILKEMCFNLAELCKSKYQADQLLNLIRFLFEEAAIYDERLRLGTASKSIFHLEAYVVKVMAKLKQAQLTMR